MAIFFDTAAAPMTACLRAGHPLVFGLARWGTLSEGGSRLMAFPESPRVVYQRNPLEAVICQLRFPPILKIEAEVPAAFQERIRSEYPLFRERRERAVPPLPAEFAKALGGDLAGVLNAIAGAVGIKAYDFATADQAWQVTLTRDFVALTSRRYTRWEEFRARLHRATDALLQDYDPSFYIRLGLRYRDVIRKTDWGLGEWPWADLLQPHIAGELSSDQIGSSVERVITDVIVRLEGGRVRMRHGLAPLGEGTNPDVYIIDSDFYTEERMEVSDGLNRLDHFNREAGRLFRWAIKDRLHDAMGPNPI